jgi:hypothetical protein
VIVNEQTVFELYCDTSASIMNAWHNIIPSTVVAKHLHCTLYKARKLIKSLVGKELLEPAFEGGFDEDNFMPYAIHGYRLSEKGYTSTEYKKAKWKDAKLCASIWGGTAYSYYK